MLCAILLIFFFFKQKTAYEMRISDWSSDVCSSDLTDEILERAAFLGRRHLELMEVGRGRGLGQGRLVADENLDGNIVGSRVDGAALGEHEQSAQEATAIEDLESAARLFHRRAEQVRSEENTSEHQTLMRISYAVFC